MYNIDKNVLLFGSDKGDFDRVIARKYDGTLKVAIHRNISLVAPSLHLIGDRELQILDVVCLGGHILDA